uniref:Uncharacterized protein n=1 Tax=Panagrolaimus sp. ES5 TaxID=591445 RepID=A0AC34G245_9BILA
MNFYIYFFLIIFHFLVIPNVNGEEKRHVDLEIFSNQNAVKQDDINADPIIYVCDDENDKTFDPLTSLVSLTVAGNLLERIDENIFTQQVGKTLLKLDLSTNKLSAINPSVFQHLVNLEHLDLQQNLQTNGKFEKFPASLSKLKELYLGECGLAFLEDDAFENLKQLETLRLSGNKFLSVPTAINVLTNLKVFRFIMTHIKTLDKNSFNSNVKLERLSMAVSYNLKSIEDCTFCNNPNLKAIDFGMSSELSYIHENAFGAISNGVTPKIKEFDVEGCNISVLHEKLLDWENVKMLAITDTPFASIDFGMSSELSYIHENAFGAISNGVTPKIKEFDVEGCNISVLHEKMLDWENVKMLAITDTPFACNCSMAWLFNDLLSKDSIYERNLIALSSSKHLKHKLGCLGPPPTSPNHTHPYTVVEIFASCKTPTSISNFWYFLILIAFICVLISIGIYANRSRFENFYTRMS